MKDKKFHIRPGKWSECNSCENKLGTKERLMELRLSHDENKERVELLRSAIRLGDNTNIGLHVRSNLLFEMEPIWYKNFNKTFTEFVMVSACISQFPCSR